MPPIVGILAFLVLVGGLFALTFVLSSRYGRGADRRRIADITREIALRDGSVGYPGTAGLPPYPGFSDDEPSPRERLKSPPKG
ncbi:MAG TPA: hypothetical protein VEU77_12030 [Candidatus Acidoferrales bacterium]|nr:hypothetical protein [Candidatus Acidoferrales bacterium]